MEFPNNLLEILRSAKKVCVLTGAGVSAESGIPTFRGGGESAVWKGMPFDQISSAKMVKENLDELWKWFDYRRGLYKDCQPNPAHFTLADWENRFEEFTLITQNVDGLHARAGSKNILELHGNVSRSYCVKCGKRFQMNAEDVPHKPEICDECGAKVRPDVVLFGEILPFEVFQKAEQKSRESDLFFIVGTSAIVYPAIGLAEIAKYSGAILVEINPEQTQLADFCDFSLRGKAGEILLKLSDELHF